MVTEDSESIAMLQAAADRGRAGSQAAEATLELRSARKRGAIKGRANYSAGNVREGIDPESISRRAASLQRRIADKGKR